ncbi:hypothetical protein [Ruminococcus flavefaciens]|uniref:hypothetical protein n=1 Tax=Ruminococcus flavefaciens TaxID=1265 RepID=UPI001146A0BF|nr:hypothetical protein [Ruminococcus flavefaciens]
MNERKILEAINMIDDDLIKEASADDKVPENVGKGFDNDITVSGVERYSRIKWHRFAAIASSVLLIAGIGAFGIHLLKNGSFKLNEGETPVNAPSAAEYAAEAETEATTVRAEPTEALPEKIFTAPELPAELKGKKIMDLQPEYCYAFNIEELENNAENSDNIIFGKVGGITYESKGGTAYTRIALLAAGDVRGQVSEGEKVIVDLVGGYISYKDKAGELLNMTGGKYGDGTNMTEEEMENTYYHEIVESGEVPIIGKEYAFFVGAKGKDSYEVIGLEYGILYKHGSSYIQRTRQGYNIYTLDELEAMLSASKKNSPDNVPVTGTVPVDEEITTTEASEERNNTAVTTMTQTEVQWKTSPANASTLPKPVTVTTAAVHYPDEKTTTGASVNPYAPGLHEPGFGWSNYLSWYLEDTTWLYNILEGLDYRPYTCDGIPEGIINGSNGLVYKLNFSERWVWRNGPNGQEEADMPEELYRYFVN